MDRQSFVTSRTRRALIAPALALVIFSAQAIADASLGFTLPALAAANKAQPNRFDPKSATNSTLHKPPTPAVKNGPTPNAGEPRRHFSVPMQPGRVQVDPVNGAHFLGSDGVFEFDVPAGAVTAADVAAAGGSMSLLIRQVLPASGSSAGGWGHYSFGTFLVQLLDASGRPAKQGPRKPLNIKLHHDKRAQALDMRHVQVLVNPSLPSWFDANPPAALPSISAPGANPSQAASTPAASSARTSSPARSAQTSASASGQPSTPSPAATGSSAPSVKPGPSSHQSATFDAGSGTLSAPVAASSSSTIVSFDTDAPVATFGKPDPFNVGLNAGSLTAPYPIDVPAGPGGLKPPLALSYSSAQVSEQHNPQGAAPWVGEGWNLSLGSISWAEHDVLSFTQTYPCIQLGTCVPQHKWEDSWQLSDPFGSGSELIPPNINVSTFLDDSGNGITASPIQWHTAPETRDKVVSFNSSMTLPGTSTPAPCFRVWLPNGIMEEFGCTSDSLQWYPQPSGANNGKAYLSSWLLDLITDPSGNQVHITYQQDMATASGLSYPRDTVPATVEWDSPGCLNAQTACTGSTWSPLMRVNFVAGHSLAHVNGSSCAANGALRCDDPIDLSGSGGLAAPTVQSDFVLNDIQVQVRSSASAGWNTLRDYQLGYDQGGPSTITDPVTGQQESTAGRLLLTQMVEIGADGSTSLPARGFSYTKVTEYYEDSAALPNPGSNCGPSWNNGHTPNTPNGPCLLWSQSYEGNSYYLGQVSNGLGLSQNYTWQLARPNSHGVASGGSPADPLYCNNSSVQGSYPCNLADDNVWSRVVLTQKSNSVVRLTQAGQGGAQTSTTVTGTDVYSYQVPYPLTGRWCGDCVAGYVWGNQSDWDYLDFYNYRFMGFAQASVSRPDGSLEVHKYPSTEGVGIYPEGSTAAKTGLCDAGNHPCTGVAWWHPANATHGHEYELDQYDTSGSTLLRQVKTQWQALCPPPGVPASPSDPSYGNWNGNLVSELDHSNPVMVCEVHPLEVDRYTFDGSSSAATHSATTYTYDGLGRVSSQAEISDSGRPGVADSSGNSHSASRNGGVAEGVPGFPTGDSAMSFDGSSGYVSAPALNLTGSITAEAWIYVPSNLQNGFIVGQNPVNQDWELFLENRGGSATLVWRPGGNCCSSDLTAPAPSANAWHHVAVSQSGTSATLYVDGTQVASSSALQAIGSTTGNVEIGRYNSGYYFAGLIDEVAVYPTALSATRIQAHFGATASSSAYGQAVLADSPASYYRLTDGGPSVSQSTIMHKPQYVWNDSVSAAASSATGTYIIDRQAFTDTEDLSGNRYNCSYSIYDGQNFTMGQSGGLTRGLATITDRYTSCGSSPNFTPSGQIRTTHTYDSFGNQLTTSDPDANAGNSAHQGCSVAGVAYSVCTTYDGTFAALPTASANALNQTTQNGYQVPSSGSSTGGFGLWPISKTDANGQTTTTTYDPLGRPISETLPGEGGGLTTSGMAYTVWCSGPSAQSPCLEVDKTQRLNSTTTVTYRAFYDGLGHLVETRSPAPGGQDVVRYRFYDPSQRLIFESVPYFVTAYTGPPGASAYSIPTTNPDGTTTQPGTSHTYDGLGRQTSITNALPPPNKTTTSRSVVCGAAGTNDSACYEQTLSVDPNGHQTGTVVDPLGRTTYQQRYSGNSSSTYAVYATSKYTYDFVGNLTQILHPNGSTQSSLQYDMAGRKTGMTDPDRGAESYSYDQDGNLVQSVDARGGGGTIFMGYDGLNRPIWRNTSNSPTGAYDTYSYDSTAGGNVGIGRLTGETFAGSAGSQLSGSYAYVYDARGRQSSSTLTVGFGAGLGAPTGVTAVAGNGQATVSWTAPASNGGSAITGYTVTASPGGMTASVNGSTTTATVTGLSNGTAYTFTVTATNGMGTGPSSAPSNQVTPATVPGAPGAVTATAGNSQATVSWAAPASNGGSAITRYTVAASPGGANVSVGPSSTSAVLGGLANGTAYTFTVTASNAMGTSPASAASASVTPAAPPGVAARDQVSPLGHVTAGTSVSTTFTTNPQPTSKLVVAVWGNDTSAPTGITDNASPANTYTLDSSVSTTNGPLGLYMYHVDNPRLPATGGLQVTASFAAASQRDIGAISYTGLAAGGPEQGNTAVGSGKTPSSGAAGISSGDVYAAAMADSNGGANTVSTASPFTQQIVEQDGSNYAVGAVSDLVGGSGAQTCNWTDNSNRPWVAAIGAYKPAPAAAPGAPTAVTASAGNAQATVSWSAPASSGGGAITGYTVTASPGGETATVAGGATTATVLGLSNGIAYTFTVAALNSGGSGPGSAASSPVTPATVPGAPLGLTASAGNAQATVSWSAPASNGGSAITGYTVTASPGGQTASINGSTTSATLSGLTNGTAYTFTVAATNAVGTSQASAPSNSVTPTAPPIYQVQTTYDDAYNVLTQTYPTGETVTNTYTAQGWLSGVSTKVGSTTTALLSNAGYTGIGGGFGEMTGASMGGTTFSATYDLLDRATDLNVKRNSDGATIFDQARTFDAAGNVKTANTTLPTGTDNQAFCYDEQDRLTWAGSAGMPPCGGTITAGSLTAAQYSQAFTYDNMGRLASGPLGTYTYGDTAHVHAATATSGGYTAKYDAAGSMSCRAPTTSATCAGTVTGAQLSYNNEGELAGWQNTPSSPSSTAAYLYDGQGERVIQQASQGGSTTTTVYVGDVEEVSTVGSTINVTTYYYANGRRIALGVNGQISYLTSDALGSSTVAFGSSGTSTASQLFAPYGTSRYANGIMPTSFGFTGQRGDSVSGLSYFHARYLDPLLGQFTSADKLLQGGGFDILGLSRYAYVEGNPVGTTDPTGHCGADCWESDPSWQPDPPPDPGPPPDPCEGSSNCGGGGPGPGDPCGGQCGGPEPGPPPDPGGGGGGGGNGGGGGSGDPCGGLCGGGNEPVSPKPPEPPPFRGYQYDWNLGISASQETPEDVMAYFQAHPRNVFPFSLGGCSTIQRNETCGLVTPFPWSDSPVKVSEVTATSFTFTTLPGHFDAAGSTVTFSVEAVNGNVHLSQTGVWVLPGVGESVKSNLSAFPAYYVWKQQASNLSSHFGATLPGCNGGNGTCLFI